GGRAREVGGGPDGQAADLLVRPEAAIDTPDSKAHSFFNAFDILIPFDRDDRGVDFLAAARPRFPDDDAVLDARLAPQLRLDVLREDVPTVGQDDHLLLPSQQPQLAPRPERADVAGPVPAVLERRRGGRLIAPVAGRYVRSAH